MLGSKATDKNRLHGMSWIMNFVIPPNDGPFHPVEDLSTACTNARSV